MERQREDERTKKGQTGHNKGHKRWRQRECTGGWRTDTTQYMHRRVCAAALQLWGQYSLVCFCFQLLSRVQLFADPINCSPPGSSIHGISQARILEWVAISFSRGSSWPGDENCNSCLAGGFGLFTTDPPGRLVPLICIVEIHWFRKVSKNQILKTH